jgi:hypothetical protein
MNFIQAYKYRGGWRGLLEHMYTVSTLQGLVSVIGIHFWCPLSLSLSHTHTHTHTYERIMNSPI